MTLADHDSLLYCDEQVDEETWVEPERCLQEEEWGGSIPINGIPSPALDPGFLCDEIRPRMRSVLFDWMQQVCQEYVLCRETFHLATTYVDLYLWSRRNTAPTSLQLVGVTALVLAAKLEEVHQPSLDEFAATCAGCCTVGEILVMETDMTSALGWTLRYGSAPAWAAAFLQRAIHQNYGEDRVRRDLLNADHYMRVMEIIDYSRLFVESLRFAPSMLAASALFYVYSAWAKPIEQAITVSLAEADPCLDWIRTVANQLPFVGLRPLPHACRGDPYQLYARQIYHPMALESCLNVCR